MGSSGLYLFIYFIGKRGHAVKWYIHGPPVPSLAVGTDAMQCSLWAVHESGATLATSHVGGWAGGSKGVGSLGSSWNWGAEDLWQAWRERGKGHRAGHLCLSCTDLPSGNPKVTQSFSDRISLEVAAEMVGTWDGHGLAWSEELSSASNTCL